MSAASARLAAAVNFALSRGQTCEAPVTPGPTQVDPQLQLNVISVATEDGVCDDDERAELERFASRARLSPAAHSAYLAALSLPRESADDLRRRQQLQDARDFARQGLETRTNEGAVVGGLGAGVMILDALFGGRRTSR
jgi:hypothetical protein